MVWRLAAVLAFTGLAAAMTACPQGMCTMPVLEPVAKVNKMEPLCLQRVDLEAGKDPIDGTVDGEEGDLQEDTCFLKLQDLLASQKRGSVVYFYAEWCQALSEAESPSPCPMGPVVESVAPRFDYLAPAFVKVDVEVNADVKQRYGLTAVPTVRFFYNDQHHGKFFDDFQGKVDADELAQWIEAQLEYFREVLPLKPRPPLRNALVDGEFNSHFRPDYIEEVAQPDLGNVSLPPEPTRNCSEDLGAEAPTEGAGNLGGATMAPPSPPPVQKSNALEEIKEQVKEDPPPALQPLTSAKSCAELGWVKGYGSTMDGVCAMTELENKCQQPMPFEEAKALCKRVGARLCSIEELDRDVARGTGCRYDKKRIWSKEVCTPLPVSDAQPVGYFTQAGRNKHKTFFEKKCSLPDEEDVWVRCCADEKVVKPGAAMLGLQKAVSAVNMLNVGN